MKRVIAFILFFMFVFHLFAYDTQSVVAEISHHGDTVLLSPESNGINADIYQWLQKHQCIIILAQSGLYSFEYQDIKYFIVTYEDLDKDYFILFRIQSMDKREISLLSKQGYLQDYINDFNLRKHVRAFLGKYLMPNDEAFAETIWIGTEMFTAGNDINPFIIRAIKNVNRGCEDFNPYPYIYEKGKKNKSN